MLTGGLAQRMGGGDKALLQIGGETILDRVLAQLGLQSTHIVLNANGDPARFGLPVVAGCISNFAGPLAGILAGIDPHELRKGREMDPDDTRSPLRSGRTSRWTLFQPQPAGGSRRGGDVAAQHVEA